MKKIIFALLIVTFVFANNVANAESVDTSKVKNAIKNLEGSYGDVPSSINCNKSQNKAETLICSDGTLLLMEELDTKAYVYAYENATGQEANHKTKVDASWIKDTRNKCANKTCLSEAFKEHTYGSLGGKSPYPFY